MAIEIGQVEAIFRYPVKSMAGESLDAAAQPSAISYQLSPPRFRYRKRFLGMKYL